MQVYSEMKVIVKDAVIALVSRSLLDMISRFCCNRHYS